MLKWWVRKYLQFYTEILCLTKPVGHCIKAKGRIHEGLVKFVLGNFGGCRKTKKSQATVINVKRKHGYIVCVQHRCWSAACLSILITVTGVSRKNSYSVMSADDLCKHFLPDLYRHWIQSDWQSDSVPGRMLWKKVEKSKVWTKFGKSKCPDPDNPFLSLFFFCHQRISQRIVWTSLEEQTTTKVLANTQRTESET